MDGSVPVQQLPPLSTFQFPYQAGNIYDCHQAYPQGTIQYDATTPPTAQSFINAVPSATPTYTHALLGLSRNSADQPAPLQSSVASLQAVAMGVCSTAPTMPRQQQTALNRSKLLRSVLAKPAGGRSVAQPETTQFRRECAENGGIMSRSEYARVPNASHHGVNNSQQGLMTQVLCPVELPVEQHQEVPYFVQQGTTTPLNFFPRSTPLYQSGIVHGNQAQIAASNHCTTPIQRFISTSGMCTARASTSDLHKIASASRMSQNSGSIAGLLTSSCRQHRNTIDPTPQNLRSFSVPNQLPFHSQRTQPEQGRFPSQTPGGSFQQNYIAVGRFGHARFSSLRHGCASQATPHYYQNIPSVSQNTNPNMLQQVVTVRRSQSFPEERVRQLQTPGQPPPRLYSPAMQMQGQLDCVNVHLAENAQRTSNVPLGVFSSHANSTSSPSRVPGALPGAVDNCSETVRQPMISALAFKQRVANESVPRVTKRRKSNASSQARKLKKIWLDAQRNVNISSSPAILPSTSVSFASETALKNATTNLTYEETPLFKLLTEKTRPDSESQAVKCSSPALPSRVPDETGMHEQVSTRLLCETPPETAPMEMRTSIVLQNATEQVTGAQCEMITEPLTPPPSVSPQDDAVDENEVNPETSASRDVSPCESQTIGGDPATKSLQIPVSLPLEKTTSPTSNNNIGGDPTTSSLHIPVSLPLEKTTTSPASNNNIGGDPTTRSLQIPVSLPLEKTTTSPASNNNIGGDPTTTSLQMPVSSPRENVDVAAHSSKEAQLSLPASTTSPKPLLIPDPTTSPRPASPHDLTAAVGCLPSGDPSCLKIVCISGAEGGNNSHGASEEATKDPHALTDETEEERLVRVRNEVAEILNAGKLMRGSSSANRAKRVKNRSGKARIISVVNPVVAAKSGGSNSTCLSAPFEQKKTPVKCSFESGTKFEEPFDNVFERLWSELNCPVKKRRNARISITSTYKKPRLDLVYLGHVQNLRASETKQALSSLKHGSCSYENVHATEKLLPSLCKPSSVTICDIFSNHAVSETVTKLVIH